VKADFNPPAGATVRAYRDKASFTGPPDAKKALDLTVGSRFPSASEKRGWRALYTPYMTSKQQ
jgi:hypothetical protein